jgi:hypothetical protein
VGDFTAQLAKKAEDVLPDGETLLAAVRALPSGAIAATVANADAADFPLAKQMVLGLTNVRLTVWCSSVWTGEPKKIIGSVPLERIESMDCEQGRQYGSICLEFKDGSTLTLDVAKRDGTAGLTTAFAEAKSDDPPHAIAS